MVLFISWIFHILLILISVAFFTLFERKVMGLFHSRVGPNKVFFSGILQPLLDAFKLLMKQQPLLSSSNSSFYFLSPIVSLGFSIFMWSFMFFFFSFASGCYSIIAFFCISSFMVFCVMVSGWASNSKYSLIGSLRSIAQSISYESVFSTILILFIFLIFSFSIKSFMEFSSVFFVLLFPIWVICILAETHRAPFDFSEAESELVSGFNTEYSGAYFAFIFLSEYSVLLFFSLVSVFIFLFWGVGLLLNFVIIIFFVFISIFFFYLGANYILSVSVW